MAAAGFDPVVLNKRLAGAFAIAIQEVNKDSSDATRAKVRKMLVQLIKNGIDGPLKEFPDEPSLCFWKEQLEWIQTLPLTGEDFVITMLIGRIFPGFSKKAELKEPLRVFIGTVEKETGVPFRALISSVYAESCAHDALSTLSSDVLLKRLAACLDKKPDAAKDVLQHVFNALENPPAHPKEFELILRRASKVEPILKELGKDYAKHIELMDAWLLKTTGPLTEDESVKFVYDQSKEAIEPYRIANLLVQASLKKLQAASLPRKELGMEDWVIAAEEEENSKSVAAPVGEPQLLDERAARLMGALQEAEKKRSRVFYSPRVRDWMGLSADIAPVLERYKKEKAGKGKAIVLSDAQIVSGHAWPLWDVVCFLDEPTEEVVDGETRRHRSRDVVVHRDGQARACALELGSVIHKKGEGRSDEFLIHRVCYSSDPKPSDLEADLRGFIPSGPFAVSRRPSNNNLVIIFPSGEVVELV